MSTSGKEVMDAETDGGEAISSPRLPIAPSDGVWYTDPTTGQKTQYLTFDLCKLVDGRVKKTTIIGEVGQHSTSFYSNDPPSPAAKRPTESGRKRPKNKVTSGATTPLAKPSSRGRASGSAKNRDAYMKERNILLGGAAAQPRKKRTKTQPNLALGLHAAGSAGPAAGSAEPAARSAGRKRPPKSNSDDNEVCSDEEVAKIHRNIGQWFKNETKDCPTFASVLDLIEQDLCKHHLVEVKKSTVPGAGDGLFARTFFKRGAMMSMLATTLLAKKMEGEMVRFCGKVPWNKKHLEIANGCMANSCDYDNGYENCGFTKYKGTCQEGDYAVVILKALRNVELGAEIFVKYDLDLEEEVVYSNPKAVAGDSVDIEDSEDMRGKKDDKDKKDKKDKKHKKHKKNKKHKKHKKVEKSDSDLDLLEKVKDESESDPGLPGDYLSENSPGPSSSAPALNSSTTRVPGRAKGLYRPRSATPTTPPS